MQCFWHVVNENLPEYTSLLCLRVWCTDLRTAEQIFIKFCIGEFTKICHTIPGSVKSIIQQWTLYTNTYVGASHLLIITCKIFIEFYMGEVNDVTAIKLHLYGYKYSVLDRMFEQIILERLYLCVILVL